MHIEPLLYCVSLGIALAYLRPRLTRIEYCAIFGLVGLVMVAVGWML